jgi:AraC-like DNA-binding protein
MLFFVETENFRVYTFGSLFFTISLLIVFLSLFLEPAILYGTRPMRKKPVENRITVSKKSGLLSNKEHLFKERLEKYFREETGFLEPQFRQQDLANYMGISRNELSHLINSLYRQNFNQLLNEKRIEVALLNLDNSRWAHLSLQGVAREVGFKSRTTFNKAFKKRTGLTPSEYKTA